MRLFRAPSDRAPTHNDHVSAGTTSQPSLGAIVNALAGTDHDTGISPSSIVPLITYWEQTRGLYRPFESDMRSSSTDVYLHEMPGAGTGFRALSQNPDNFHKHS